MQNRATLIKKLTKSINTWEPNDVYQYATDKWGDELKRLSDSDLLKIYEQLLRDNTDSKEIV